MFTVFVGPVGSGKTYSMVRQGKIAFERGEPVFANFDLDVSQWDAKRGGRYVRWSKLSDLLSDEMRCGTILWDELGAMVNSREYENFPIKLTVKLLEHRKQHLDIFGSVQNAELTDKNVRRLFNRVYFVKEHRLPLLGLLAPTSKRPRLTCALPECIKNGSLVTRGDTHTVGTFYSCKDVDPKRTENVQKFNSKGTTYYLFDPVVSSAYLTTARVASEASRFNEDARRTRRRR